MATHEATKQLFEAAKKGDVAAARTAIEAGAILDDRDDQGRTAVHVAELYGNDATAKYLAQEKEDQQVVRWAPVVAGGMLFAFFGILSLPRMDDSANIITHPHDGDSAQRQLRSALADPTITERIIKLVKDPAVIQQFMDDPEIMQNLRRLTSAMESEKKEVPG